MRRLAIHSYRRLRAWAIARRHRIPAPIRLWLRRTERALDPIPVALHKLRTGERRPIPPRGLRERNSVDALERWWAMADEAERPLHELLRRAGHTFEDFDRALDFGCGAGKVISLLRGRGVELHGCDIHEPSIRWLRRTYPDLHVVATEFDPPLPYEADYFDVVWAWSVLTHLDPDRQRAWIGEWMRIVRPGGLVLATFNPPWLAEYWAREGTMAVTADVAARAEEEGGVFVRAAQDGNFSADFAGTTEAYGDTFNTPERIQALAVEAGFEVLEMVPNAVWGLQQCAILRAPARTRTPH